MVDHVIIIYLLDKLGTPARQEGTSQKNPSVAPKSRGLHIYSPLNILGDSK